MAQIKDPMLVIADNASSEAQVRPLLPGAGRHKAVVTSRHTLADLDAALVDVTVLDHASAVDLLDGALRVGHSKDGRITGDRDGARRLAEVCGGLPLALRIVAALLKAELTLSAGELAEELMVESERLEQLRYGYGTGPNVLSVEAAFELSYRRLEELEEVQARIFRLLPVNPGPDLSTAAAAALADLPVRKVRQALRGLGRAHLVEKAPGADGRWRMHDLLRLYARRLSDKHADADGREQARKRILNYYLSIADAANNHLEALPGMVLPENFTGRDDALAWLDAERPNLVAAVTMAARARNEVAVELPLALAQYFYRRRRLDDWLTTLDKSLQTARLLGDRTEEGTALARLGWALNEAGRPGEAILACQDAVTICGEFGDRHGEGMALNTLGRALYQVRRLGEAIAVLEDAVAICRETGDRHEEGIALTNQGLALGELGRLDEAITAHQDAVAICQEIGDRREEGMVLTNLGGALRKLGRLDEAIIAHQDAVAICQETGDRHGKGIALGNLGGALREVRRFEDAIAAHKENLAICRETGDRRGEGMVLDNLGIALREADRFEQAIIAHQDAATIFRETGDRYHEGIALKNLETAIAAQQA